MNYRHIKPRLSAKEWADLQAARKLVASLVAVGIPITRHSPTVIRRAAAYVVWGELTGLVEPISGPYRLLAAPREAL